MAEWNRPPKTSHSRRRWPQSSKSSLKIPSSHATDSNSCASPAQPSGTLYPILMKFERAGWLTAGKEDIDPKTEGRPARRFYRITGSGALAAHLQLVRSANTTDRPPPSGRASHHKAAPHDRLGMDGLWASSRPSQWLP